MNISRRQFLKTSFVAASGAALMSSPVPLFANPAVEEGIDLSLLKNAWTRKNLPPPLVYLKEAGLLSLSANIQEASRKDFQAGRMLSVGGLMLSHAESAFLLSAAGGFHV